jgi:hypothetical protein
MIMRKVVVFPAPFGPMTPTIPPRQTEREVLHQELVAVGLRDPIEDDHIFAQPLGLRDEDLGGAHLLRWVSEESSSKALMRAFPLDCRARGDIRIQSSSR